MLSLAIIAVNNIKQMLALVSKYNQLPAMSYQLTTNTMNIIYIGQYTPGTTSKMRADQLKETLSKHLSKIQLYSTDKKENNTNLLTFTPSPLTFKIIDTNIPFYQTNRIWRSLGFRYKKGPLIRKINKYIINEVNSLIGQKVNRIVSENSTTNNYELNTKSYNLNPNTYKSTNLTTYRSNDLFTLIWIDKAIFLTPKTTQYLKSLTTKLVHFTPDMAFFGNQSSLFNKSLKYYDYMITTKTKEIVEYKKHGIDNNLIITTQGFDKEIHKPLMPFSEKENSVAFIGLYESYRDKIIQKLIDNQINVNLAGKGWILFVEKNKKNSYLSYFGEGLFSEDYTQFLSSSYFSIGLLSKNFPELHTTRTFEIPACGTALITEKNEETSSFFTNNEAIFYNDIDDIIDKIKYYQENIDELEILTQKGMQRVHKNGRDYNTIMTNILKDMGFRL